MDSILTLPAIGIGEVTRVDFIIVQQVKIHCVNHMVKGVYIWKNIDPLPDPMLCTPRERPRNFDLVQIEPLTYMFLDGHSA